MWNLLPISKQSATIPTPHVLTQEVSWGEKCQYIDICLNRNDSDHSCFLIKEREICSMKTQPLV